MNNDYKYMNYDCKYMKIMYVHCGWRNEYRSDPRSYEHYWTSSWNKAWKIWSSTAPVSQTSWIQIP